MRKWTYRVATGPEASGDGLLEWLRKPTLAAWLNEMGEQGWELVRLDSGDEAGLAGMLNPSRWIGVFKRHGGEVELWDEGKPVPHAESCPYRRALDAARSKEGK